MVSAQGAVLLNYVAPEARFSGVSKALLGALEGAAWDMGARRCHLHSTQTAARFYRAHGYTAEAGAPLHMVKPLHADARPRGAAPV